MRFKNKQQWYQYYGLWNSARRVSMDDLLAGRTSDVKHALRKVVGHQGKFPVGPASEIRRIALGMSEDERGMYSVTEVMPDDRIVVQGNYDGVCAEVTFKKCTMGELVRSPDPADHVWQKISRLQLLDLVGRELYDVLEGLVELHGEGVDVTANPVVEFSLYDGAVGNDGLNYVIWEVRHY